MDDVCLPVTRMITMEDPQSEYAAFERRHEHARLKEAVVEAAKAWHAAPNDYLSLRNHDSNFPEMVDRLENAVDALLEFEKDLAA